MLRFTTVALDLKVWIQTSLLPSMLSVTMDVTMKLSLFVGHDILHPWDPFLGAHGMFLQTVQGRIKEEAVAQPVRGFQLPALLRFLSLQVLENHHQSIQFKSPMSAEKVPSYHLFFDLIHAKKTRLTFLFTEKSLPSLPSTSLTSLPQDFWYLSILRGRPSALIPGS